MMPTAGHSWRCPGQSRGSVPSVAQPRHPVLPPAHCVPVSRRFRCPVLPFSHLSNRDNILITSLSGRVICICCFKCPCSAICPDATHAGLRQPVNVKHRQEREVKSCCCLWFVLFQLPGGWEHHVQVLSTKMWWNFYLFSLSFFSFPNTFKDLICKSTVKLLRMPAVVQQLGTIQSVYSSTALRCTLMEQAEASFIIIII